MSASITLATARRILTQLRHDPRTIVMLLAVPTLLIVLLRFVFNSAPTFSHVAPALLGVFPFVMPLGRLDLLFGYAIAFGLLAILQVAIATGVSLLWLGLTVSGSVWMLLLIAVLDALLGMALGLFVSAFAATEFQVIQFMPLFVLPQLLLCGLFVPRDQMAVVLSWLSDAMPLSYAVEGLTAVTVSAAVDAAQIRSLIVMAGCTVLALVLGAGTLRRRTP